MLEHGQRIGLGWVCFALFQFLRRSARLAQAELLKTIQGPQLAVRVQERGEQGQPRRRRIPVVLETCLSLEDLLRGVLELISPRMRVCGGGIGKPRNQ